jgi:tRNA-Thr(GGU) m(6)t(6)A37 methyltransferase TsaA
MTMQELTYRTIGIIHSEHTVAEKTPIQPVYAQGCMGQVEVFTEFAEGLKDLQGFSHVYLIYHFHQSLPAKLIVKPFLHDIEHGIFATRAPCRPNAIGLSVVELEKIEGRILHVNGVDILDGTPLLDIKPYTAKFDLYDIKKNGWQDDVEDETARRKGKRGYRS